MHPLQRQLYKDHYHFQRLLYCLQKEINCYDADTEESPNLPVILDALDYVQTYPERWHHPIEDVIFNCLLEKDITERAAIESLLAEHKELEHLTKRACQLFTAVANDCVVPIDELTDVARQFILRQSAHLDRENELVYPLMNQYLSQDDWDRIAQSLEQIADPLFDKPLQADYENLYQSIVEMENDPLVSVNAR